MSMFVVYLLYCSQLNIAAKETYNLMEDIMNEIKEIFPDSYVHIGGDEVGTRSWDEDETVKTVVNAANTTLETLIRTYLSKVGSILGKDHPKYGKRGMIAWEDTPAQLIKSSGTAKLKSSFDSNTDHFPGVERQVECKRVYQIGLQGYRLILSRLVPGRWSSAMDHAGLLI